MSEIVVPDVAAQHGSMDQSVQKEQQLVLIADDEAPIAETLADLVVMLGFQAITAPHGRAALELARQHWPALLLTDLMMPHLSGAQLIASLREVADQAHLPMPYTVVLTAAGQKSAKGAQADEIILKPFNLDDIEAVVIRVLIQDHHG